MITRNHKKKYRPSQEIIKIPIQGTSRCYFAELAKFLKVSAWAFAPVSEKRLSSLWTMGNNLNVWFGNLERSYTPRNDIVILSHYLKNISEAVNSIYLSKSKANRPEKAEWTAYLWMERGLILTRGCPTKSDRYRLRSLWRTVVEMMVRRGCWGNCGMPGSLRWKSFGSQPRRTVSTQAKTENEGVARYVS